METSPLDSPPISPPMFESSLVDIVVENMEPMVIIHPGVIEDMDVKPPTPSTPLPPASTINSDAKETNPTIRKAFLLVKFGCGSSFFLLLITFGSVLRIRIRKDPKLLAGSVPEPKLTFRIRFRILSRCETLLLLIVIRT